MNLTKKLNHKLNGVKMLMAGVGGVIINEIDGALRNEPLTTYQLNKLSRGYIIKGYGHLTKNNNLINKGRNYINEYKSRQRIKQKIIEGLK